MAKYPEYPIPQYPYETMQVWRNMVSQIDNGREQRRRKSTFPTYDVTLMYNALETADIDKLWNFYQDMEGTFHEFYFFTPIDEKHKGLFVAVGDGVKDTYDLPGIVAGATTVYVDGLPTAVTLLTGGGDEGADRCVFDTPPSEGSVISCDLFGQQRIRCRFAEDNLSRELFMARIYRTGIKLKGLKG